ncbi:MAG: F-type H+-transporting ATPase subunit epsilon [Candidatus Tokpelaia sp. JSC189]|nr:MAG: F-type H+-transporting ATPase subunit epsilon [Candidatus Tokpelaia sp. JSC189]
MARNFQFELVSPENLLFSEAVEQVLLPGCRGYLTVMVGHSPMITRIIPGVVNVRFAGTERRAFIVFEGFVDIRPEICSLLAKAVVPIEQFDPHDIDFRIAKAHGELKAAKTDYNRNKAEELFYQLTAVRGADRLA